MNGLKERLEARRAELEAGMPLLDRIAVERAPDEVENLQLAGERDLVITRLDRQAALLAEIHAAQGRIEDGSYGVCLNCGREISLGRLSALPWASCCVTCQEELDRKRDWARGSGSFAGDGEAA